MREHDARRLFAVTAACVIIGIVIQLFVAADHTGGRFTTTWQRVLNVFVFFTILSNVLVGVTTLLLAIRLDRTSLTFRVARLMGMVGIVVTAIVYHVAIRAFLHLDSWALGADHMLHTVVPVLAVWGWVKYGPRGLTSPLVARLTVIFPLTYFAFTLVRGAVVDWYPYTFIDVTTLGYGKVALNAVWIALLVFAIAAGATALDARLALGRTGSRPGMNRPAVPTTMPAAVLTGPAAIEVQDLAVPPIGAGEVLVEVVWCGICGTDLHLALEGYGRPGSVLGHEWSGTVVAVGEAVTDVAVGSTIVADDTRPCGECRPCRRGRPSVCRRRPPPDHLSFRGAFARYAVVSADRALPVPSGLDAVAAALTEPVAIALHAMHLAEATDPALRILVTGAGPVGLLMVAVLAEHGVTDVTVSEPSAVRRTRATVIGARAVCTPDDLPAAPMGRPVPEPFDIAYECSGHTGAAAQALDQLDAAGTLVFVGTGREQPTINHNRMIILELSAIGTYNYDAAGFAPALDLLASGRLPLELLIEPGDVGLDAVLPTMHRLAVGELAGKVLVRPR